MRDAKVIQCREDLRAFVDGWRNELFNVRAAVKGADALIQQITGVEANSDLQDAMLLLESVAGRLLSHVEAIEEGEQQLARMLVGAGEPSPTSPA